MMSNKVLCSQSLFLTVTDVYFLIADSTVNMSLINCVVVVEYNQL